MAVTSNSFTGNGSQTSFNFTFKWLQDTDIDVTIDNVAQAVTTNYTLSGLNYTTRSGGTVVFNTAPANGAAIRIFRVTADSDLAGGSFNSGSAIRAADLNENYTQVLYRAQEIGNYSVQDTGNVTLTANYTFSGTVSGNTPTLSTHLATKGYIDGLVLANAIPDGDRGDVTVTGSGSTWSILPPIGSATTPAFRFKTDTNTGIYSPGADQVAISTGGTGRLFVDANGDITSNTSPSTTLSVRLYGTATGTSVDATTSRGVNLFLHQTSNTNNNTSAILFANALTNTGAYIAAQYTSHTNRQTALVFGTGDNAAPIERARIDSSGRVGIGTASPTGTLTVTGNAVGTYVTLTDAATIATNMSLGNNFQVTLAGNRTLDAPTNVVAGQSGIIRVIQDATGSRTLAYNSVFKFPGGTAPTLTTTANAVDLLAYHCESATRIAVRFIGDVK